MADDRRITMLPTLALRKQDPVKLDAEMATNTLIVDIGSGWIKAGRAISRVPEFSEPGIVDPDANFGFKAEDHGKRVVLNKRGVIDDFAVFENVLSSISERMNFPLEGKNLIVTQPLFNSDKNRQKVGEIAFEKFQVGALQILNDSVMTAFSEDRRTCLVLDVGDGLTSCVPLLEAAPMVTNARVWRFGSRDMTEYIRNDLSNSSGESVSWTAARQYKESCCCSRVLADKVSGEKEIGGKTLDAGDNRFTPVDAYMNPMLFDREDPGLADMIVEVLGKCPIDIRKDLQTSIMLTGGGSKMQGLDIQLYDTLSSLLPKNAKFELIKSDCPSEATFIGITKLLEMEDFTPKLITLSDFKNIGNPVFKRLPYL